MSTSAISHLRYDFDNYIVELQRLTNLASIFIIKDALIRYDYLHEINVDIQDYQSRFDAEINPQKKIEIIEDLKAEVRLTESEYQILRMKDHVTYIVTDVFEEHGILKYAKIAGGIVAGGMEAWGGIYLAKIGKSLKIKRFKGVGVILFAYGINNVYESASPLLYEHSQSGPLRDLYRKAAELAGLGDNEGDFGYSSVELSLSIYSAIRSPVLAQNPGRLVSKYLFEKPGTGKLFRYVNNDYITKWASKNGMMKLYFTGKSAHDIKAKFYDGDYKYDDSFSLSAPN
ncbi:MAG: DUF4225 domain-containing protein [Gibbsiella quercinecans]|uniref:DUF4225 domain-containing protein n=1 Tax=Gibbsiella quercinecans TaxID=929813 RepID=UPI003F2BBE21